MLSLKIWYIVPILPLAFFLIQILPKSLTKNIVREETH